MHCYKSSALGLCQHQGAVLQSIVVVVVVIFIIEVECVKFKGLFT